MNSTMVLFHRAATGGISAASSVAKMGKKNLRSFSSLAASSDAASTISNTNILLADYNFGPCDIVKQILISQNTARSHHSTPTASASPLSRLSPKALSADLMMRPLSQQCLQQRRHFSSDAPTSSSLDGYYHIEISNGLEDDDERLGDGFVHIRAPERVDRRPKFF